MLDFVFDFVFSFPPLLAWAMILIVAGAPFVASAYFLISRRVSTKILCFNFIFPVFWLLVVTLLSVGGANAYVSENSYDKKLGAVKTIPIPSSSLIETEDKRWEEGTSLTVYVEDQDGSISLVSFPVEDAEIKVVDENPIIEEHVSEKKKRNGFTDVSKKYTVELTNDMFDSFGRDKANLSS